MSAPLATIVDQAGESLGGFLPRVGGALLLLLVGIVIARIAGRLSTRALRSVNLDEHAERWGVQDVLERIGLGGSLATLAGSALRIGLTLVVVFASVSLLGLQFLSESLNQAVLFLPKLLSALALVLVGLALGGFVRERVDRAAYQMDLPLPAGQLAQVAVIAAFVLMAAAQVAISTLVLLMLVGILLAAAAATLTLAFGLGGRDVARSLSAGRYISGAFEVGQTVAFGSVRGEIVSIESAATVLRADDGQSVRVPNHVLLDSVVRIETTAGRG